MQAVNGAAAGFVGGGAIGGFTGAFNRAKTDNPEVELSLLKNLFFISTTFWPDLKESAPNKNIIIS